MNFNTLCASLASYTSKCFNDIKYKTSKDWFYDFDLQSQNYDKNLFFLRHDIDIDIDTAYEMAKIEERYNIKANYFVLINSDNVGNGRYFSSNKAKTISILKEIEAMGHEIGIHYNLIGDYFEHGLDPIKNLEEQINIYKDADIKIFGAASHGSQYLFNRVRHRTQNFNYPPEYINYEIFQEWSNNKTKNILLENKVLNISNIFFKNFNLFYEAYHIKKDAYFSDATPGQNTFLWNRDSEILPVPGLKKEKNFLHPLEYLEKSKDKVAQILIHPCRWKGNL